MEKCIAKESRQKSDEVCDRKALWEVERRGRKTDEVCGRPCTLRISHS